MSTVITRLTIIETDDGTVELEGTGANLKKTGYVYGLLEQAKDIVRNNYQAKQRIGMAGGADISQFTKQ